MNQGTKRLSSTVLLLALVSLWSGQLHAQVREYERTFPQSKEAVEKALKQIESSTAGRLPVLEGFATSTEHPLDRYERGYYQAKFQVTTRPGGGSVVRVTVQVTAWYADPVSGRSGYQVLTSNGRVEADLLDDLAEQLAGKASPGNAGAVVAAAAPERSPWPKAQPSQVQANQVQTNVGKANGSQPIAAQVNPATSEPVLSAPLPRLPETGGFSSSLAQTLSGQEKSGVPPGSTTHPEKSQSALQSEADGLEEILKNQAHPKNLVAVKKSGTPVVETASLTAKTLFLASAHDEFEMLDFDRDWVHVRVSGLSRGWIWRNNLEMPEGIPDNDLPKAGGAPSAADLFHVSREEPAIFPGDWAPLRGKTVKIVSVENTSEGKTDIDPKLRLEFVKSLLDQDYAQLSQKPQDLAGIVVIFDSADGGMIAATFPTLKQWKAGSLSDAALWHQCFFDPPETFIDSSSQASR
jgi:hypothetical protein